jgi:hypothetical protein
MIDGPDKFLAILSRDKECRRNCVQQHVCTSALLRGASGYAALRRTAPPHGPSPWLGSGARHIRAIRYGQLRRNTQISDQLVGIPFLDNNAGMCNVFLQIRDVE